MSSPTNPKEPFSPFLPSTYTVPEEEDRRRSFLSETFSQLSDVVNDKVIGAFTDGVENQNGTKWSYDTTAKTRAGSQAIARVKSFVTGPIPMPIKGVNQQFIITKTWGSASKPASSVGAGDGDYFTFLPQGDTRIQYTMTDTTINITATAPMAAYNGFIIIEYIRDGV